jgi:hypothetical protein
MKSTSYYPKVVIHNLGNPSVRTMPCSALTVWLRLISLAMVLVALHITLSQH